MDQPFILCGLGRVGWRVLEYLRAAGLPVVVIDLECEPDDPRLHGVRLIRGDCRRREVLEDAGVTKARGVLVLTSEDLVSISTALTVRNLHPQVRVVIRMFNQNLIGRLGKAVHNVYALSTSTLTAPLLALTAMTGQALGTFRLQGVAEPRRQVAEVTVLPLSSLEGERISDFASRRELAVLACFRKGEADLYLRDVDLQSRLATGDHVVVCGDPRKIAPLLAPTDDDLAHVRWAGQLRRYGRVFWRTASEVDLAVKIAGAVLFGVIAVSTLVFRLAFREDRSDSLAHAFFRAVSVMATGSDMHVEELSAGWPKVFAAVLRISGAALTAAFTAILTNYLLRARLGGALEVRRIPDSGHVIVCGLGNIGFRVVEELAQTNERVVVIELASDGRFVSTTRRLGAAVIIGDATVREVLRQAHAANARAIIAATSNDLVNLEVALLAREMAPAARIVVRLWDSELAQTLREEAGVRLALSIPALSAPAFVAALFGDQVHSVFLVGGRLMAAMDITVGAADVYFLGHSVQMLAQDYHLLPIALLGDDGKLRTPLLDQELRLGDRLTAIAALTDLGRLLQREATTRDVAIELALPRSSASAAGS